MKKLLKALELDEAGDENAILNALAPLQGIKAQVLALSGKATLAEAFGALSAMKDQAARTETLTNQLEELRAEVAKAEIDRLIDESIKDGRRAPSQRDELLATAKQFGVDGLKSFLSMLSKPPAAAVAPAKEPAQLSANSGLSAEQLAVIKKIPGMTAEKFAAHSPEYRGFLHPEVSEGK